MNKDEIDFFMKNGYYILKNAIDKDFCKKVVNNAKECLLDNYGKNYDKKFFHLKVSPWSGFKSLKNTFDLKYKLKEDKAKILNEVAKAHVNDISNGVCITSFKTDNNEINWHLDGWEHHWLTQPLHSTCVIAYTDTDEGTWVAPESIKMITELFYNNNFMFYCENFLEWSPLVNNILSKCKDIRQISLKQGDMLVTHPFLLHAANNNKTQDIRVVTNYHLYRNINIKDPISLVEKRINQDLLELKLDPNLYKLDTSKNLSNYESWLFRKNHEKEYNLFKNQLIFLQKNNIINKDNNNFMKNNFNKNNHQILDKFNNNVYNLKKKRFSKREN